MRRFLKNCFAVLLVALVSGSAHSPAHASAVEAEAVNGAASALVLIEYQREWLDAQGKLHSHFENKELLRASLANSALALAAARRAGIKIVHVGLRFTPGYPELGPDARYGLRKGIQTAQTFQMQSNTSEFVPPFAPLAGEFVVSGRTGSSAFAGSNLESYLRNNHITDLYIMGYATHVCVESTFRQAHDLGYNTTVISDATAAFNKQQQDYFIENIAGHFGRNIKAATFAAALADKDTRASNGR